MTSVTIPNSHVNAALSAISEAGLRPPDSVQHPTDFVTAELTWTPDLSAADQTTLSNLRKLIVGAVLITPAERAALEPDIDGLRTYANLATPTLAQTVLAVKAQSRILRALLRD